MIQRISFYRRVWSFESNPNYDFKLQFFMGPLPPLTSRYELLTSLNPYGWIERLHISKVYINLLNPFNSHLVYLVRNYMSHHLQKGMRSNITQEV